jgi:hypothetical protein
MGEHFFPDLSNAFRTVSVSRKQALQLLGGAIAVAVPSRVPPAADARTHPKPPLAFVAGALVDGGLGVAGTPGTFVWAFRGAIETEFGSQLKLDTTVELSAAATTDQVRKHAVAALRTKAADTLAARNITVPEDRIAVTLL